MTLLVTVAVGALLVLPGCGPASQAKATTPPAGVVGYWALPAGFTKRLLEIDRVGESYAVGWNGNVPAKVSSSASTLLLQKGEVSNASETPTLQAVLNGDKLTLISSDPASGRIVRRLAPTPLSRTGYLTAVATLHEWQVHWAAEYLSVSLDLWAHGHAGIYPRPSQVAAGALFGAWLAKVSAGANAWPANPYTSKPMRPGSDPGNYTYTSNGSRFTLIFHLPNGQTYTRRSGESGTPPGLSVKP